MYFIYKKFEVFNPEVVINVVQSKYFHVMYLFFDLFILMNHPNRIFEIISSTFDNMDQFWLLLRKTLDK